MLLLACSAVAAWWASLLFGIANMVNPYEPPAEGVFETTAQAVQYAPENLWADLCFDVIDASRTWATREIDLFGDVCVRVRYEAYGHGERVYVDQQLAARTSPWGVRLTLNSVSDSVDFPIGSAIGWVPATIDVYASMLRLARISRFRLTVAGRVIYEES